MDNSKVKSLTMGSEHLRWDRIRIVVALVLLGTEIFLYLLLRTKGWQGTANSLGWLGSCTLFVLPLVIAFLFFAWRRCFTIRTLLFATALVAVFVAFNARPFANTRAGLQATRRLEASGVGLHEDTSLDTYFTRLGIQGVRKRSPIESSPTWIKRLLDKDALYADQIVEIGLWADDQIDLFLENQSELPNLRYVRVYGRRGNARAVTPAGLKRLAENLRAIESLAIINIDIPEHCCRSLESVRHLTIHTAGQMHPGYNLTDEQLFDIAETNGLEILRIARCNLNDQKLNLLVDAPKLRHLDCWQTQVTQSGCDEIRETNNRIKIHLSE